MTKPQRLLATPEAAEYLGNKPTTLAIWRSQGTGPEYIKGRHSVRYTLEALIEWGTGGWHVQQRIEETAACHVEHRARTRRPRGRAWVKQREEHLLREPYCRACRRAGVDRLANEVDHILPLRDLGTNDKANLQSLCVPCHATRTRARLDKKY